MKHTIGIDLGGTYIKYGLVKSSGQSVFEGIIPTEADRGPETVIRNLIRAIENVRTFSKEKDIQPFCIGIGTPGIVDRSGRIVVGGADNIPGWVNINLADKIEAACNLPVAVINDANAMGLAEQSFGAAQNCSDVVFLTVGTGIGGTVIIDGKLYGGYQNRGTELGHIPLFSDGIPCTCGSVGCLEAYASTSALVNQFEELCQKNGVVIDEEISGKLIVKLFNDGHSIAHEALNEHCRYLGRGIAGLVNIFSPQRVVIGGGISESGAFYIEKIRENFQRYVMPDCALNTEICVAQLGNRAGIAGAARWGFISGKS